MTSASKVLVVLVTVAIVAVAVGVGIHRLTSSSDLVIGGKDFTEQSILAEMMAVMIEENTALTCKTKTYLGGTMVCWNGLKSGQLDGYAEYTGTGLVTILNRDVIPEPNAAYRAVREAFESRHGVIWLEPLGFNNTYTLTMRRGQAEELGIATISELAAYVRSGKKPRLTAAFTAEFLQRPDGYEGLVEAYDLRFRQNPKQLAPGLMYTNCAGGAVDVICGFATDGRIAAFDLKTLEDDRRFFPPYYAAPVFRAETLKAHPAVREQLNRLAGRIDDRTMRRLNYQVDRKDNPRDPADVAREFLAAEGLIPAATTRAAQ